MRNRGFLIREISAILSGFLETGQLFASSNVLSLLASYKPGRREAELPLLGVRWLC